MDTEAAQLHRLNRMHMLLSRVSRTIVRVESPDQLYQDVCRFAVESGLFELAWIGLAEPDGELSAIARCGEFEALVEQACAAEQDPDTPPGLHAVWGDKAGYVCNRLSELTVWRVGAAAVAGGLAAMGRFALHDTNRVCGVLELYSAQADIFDSEVLSLLEEIADDVSFALRHLSQEQQRLAAETKAHYLAYYDAQTGLPARALLDQHLARVCTAGAPPFALLAIKLHRLDVVARALGRTALDQMLRSLAHRLEDFCGSAVLLAQVSQDTFVLPLPELTEQEMIVVYAHQLLACLKRALAVEGREVFLQAAIGVARFPLDDAPGGQLLQHVRIAAESAYGAGDVCFYHAGLDSSSASRLALEAELHRALERDEFELHYQPQLSLKNGQMMGVEALLRWRHPQKGMLAPGLFIPVLEECSLMKAVGAWVLRQACVQNRAWQEAGLPPLRVAVNLSAQQFRTADLLATVEEVLADSGLAAEWLELELTESLVLEDCETSSDTLYALKNLGVSISLDDFGTGYSSLSYLRRLPIDRIKIDQSFIRELTTQADSASLVRAILAMADSLGMDAIAEGVENTAQLNYLRKYGCQEMQGYVFSRAVPAEEIVRLLKGGEGLLLDGSVDSAGHTILVVDDEPGILAAIKRTLRRDGLIVLTAANAEEGYQLLAEHEVGLVISDYRMPGTTGNQFLGQVKELHPDAIRILLTGYAEINAMLSAINQGELYKILLKPWDDKQLRECVREALRRFKVEQENRQLKQRLLANELQERESRVRH